MKHKYEFRVEIRAVKIRLNIFIQSDTSIWQQQKPEKSLKNNNKKSLKIIIRVIGGSKTDST